MRKILSCFALLFCGVITQAQEKWEIFGNLKVDLVYPSIAKVGKDRAIILGGYYQLIWNSALSNAEMLEYNNGKTTHTSLPSMPSARVEFPVVNFHDTLIVAIGGYAGGGVSKQVDAYSLKTGQWRVLGNLKTGRRQHVAYQFSDHEIIVVGGRHASLATMNEAEIFDIRTGTTRSIADYPFPINGGVGGLTSEGVGVIAGGRDGGPNGGRIPGIYTYDEANNTWVEVGNMTRGREASMSGRLDNGSFVIAGGSFREENPVIFTGEVWVEEEGDFSLAGDIGYGVTYCGVAEHRSGEVFIVGGWLSDLSSTNACTFVDATTGKVTPGPKLNIPRRYTRAVTLQDRITGRRATYAIGGASNGGFDHGTFTIEILEGEDDCENETTDVLGLSGLRMSGTAIKKNGTIWLTDTTTFSAGAAWVGSKVAVGSTFSTQFTFRISEGNDHDLKDGGPEGADGIALVIQNESPAGVGDAGMGIGYHDLPHGLAVEFDSYLNGAYSDAAGTHAAVQVGDGYKLSANHRAPYLKAMTWEKMPALVADGATYHAKIEYDGSMLRVWCDTTGEFKEPLIEVGIDVAKELGLGPDGRAWMGITSATGFSTERHEITGWTIGTCDPILVSVDDEPSRPIEPPLRIVPQPTHDVATLELHEAFGDAVVIVSSVSGQEMLRFNIANGQRSIQLPTQELHSGTYVVRVIDVDRSASLLWNVLH